MTEIISSRQRVKDVLAHKQADKLAIDFGASPVTGIHVRVIEKLRRYYGLSEIPVKVTEPYQMLGKIDPELSGILEIDVLGISPRENIFGFENIDWKEFKTSWGQVILVPGKFLTLEDENGDLLIYPKGDISAPPSGRMPVSGFFFDTIIRQEPLDEANLNVEDNLEEYGRRITAETRRLHAYLRRRNANTRDPELLEVQRREHRRVRSEKQQRWGRPKNKAA